MASALFIDRFTGAAVIELPSPAMEGRYSVTRPATLGGHTPLQVGDVLVGDGTAGCQVGEAIVAFSVEDLGKRDATRAALCADAVRSIARRADEKGLAAACPLLAIDLASEVRPTKLEVMLHAVVAKHHLRAIEESPHIEVEYTDEVTPVGRARRLSTRAAVHLASHSEFWQQRTFTGVVPREVLARFSNDRYAIYENVVFSRLLDRLEHVLDGRWQRLNELRANLEAGLNFQVAHRSSFHRFYSRVCELWGEVYRGDAAEEGLDAAEQCLVEVSKLLDHIRTLKRGRLYALIPAGSPVSGVVVRTNLLMHDQHYRHLPRLWDEAKVDQAEKLPTEAETARQRMHLQGDYSKYVGVVLSRALLKHGILLGRSRRGSATASLANSGSDWLLTHSSGATLLFVPCWSAAALDSSIQATAGMIVCVPELKETLAFIGDTLPAFARVSPLDLCVVERMGVVVDQWLGGCAGRDYAQSLSKVPSAVTEEFKDWNRKAVEVEGSSVRILAPGTSAERMRALSVALRTGSAQTVEALTNAFEAVCKLSTCPECGNEGVREAGRQRTFWATCSEPSCQSSWGVQLQGTRRKFRLEPRNAESLQEFVAVGRSRFSIRLD